MLILCLGSQAQAQQVSPDRMERLEQELLLRDRLIRNLLDRVNALEDRVEREAVPGDSRDGRAEDAIDRGSPGFDLAERPDADGERLARLRAGAAFERALIQRGGLLLPPGAWELEPAVSYTHSSSDQVVIDGFTVAQVLVIGDIFNERVDRDTVQTTLTARRGLPDDWQLELRVPFAAVRERRYTAQNQEVSSSRAALGDIEVAASHQFYRGLDADPSLLGSLRWKLATGDDPFAASDRRASVGSGYHSVQGTLTAILISDPVVFFGGVSYTANLADGKTVGRIDPGDSVGFQAGMAIALNMDTSLSLGWEQRITERTRIEGRSIPGSYLTSGSLTFGVSHTTYSGNTYDLSASIGLTRDSPDAQISLGFPIRF